MAGSRCRPFFAVPPSPLEWRAPGAVTIGLRPEHLTFAEAGLPGRITQTEPMGREILYVVETDLGHVRVLEHGASAAHAAGDPVKIGFSPDDSLVFNTATESLMTGARVHPPSLAVRATASARLSSYGHLFPSRRYYSQPVERA
jgi:hypothetical protein